MSTNNEIPITQYCGKADVVSVEKIAGQGNVFLLRTKTILETETQAAPLPGQFYMIKASGSDVQFGRPISVYHSEKRGSELFVDFMILEKGRGTVEMSGLISGDRIDMNGPMGNSFSVPEGTELSADRAEICICGGGIGVAPVANFASSLKEKSYDFYASFKSGSYGLEHVKPSSLTVTTDDGSTGIKGMITAALTKEIIQEKGYKLIFACGPTPMLAYIQKIAAEANVKCFLSVEKKMLCGVGACLGCTIHTKEKNKRVCKDGPVFDGEELIFDKGAPSSRKTPLLENETPDLSVEIAGVKFRNPVIAASGTFGFGQNYRGFFDVNRLGGISSKGCTLNAKPGNEGERIIEVASGDINSIGLENPGIEHFIAHELPEMLELDPVSIANLAGSDLDSYVKGAELLDKSDVQMIELNISCPNVKAGGMAWGMEKEAAFQCVSAVRKATKKPLIVKLSPNAPDLVGIAMTCIEAGADALSLINTIQAISIDIEKGRPYFNNIKAGLCGPAVKPIALRMVYDVVQAVKKLPDEKQVPVIGLGGISCWQDAVEFIMAGASAIQVGTATFSNPKAMVEIIEGLEKFMKSHGYRTLADFRGIAL